MKTSLIYFISSFAFIVSCLSRVEADGKTIYNSQGDKSNEQAVGYSKTDQSLSRYLAYRDIPSLIAQYCHGKKALDYGAGTGLSAQFLKKQALDVMGVDISKEMLAQASINCPNTSFSLIENGCIPSKPEAYDLVFSSFVLFELGSKEEILAYLKEAKRVLKKDGVFIALTGSQEMYSKDWLLFNVDFSNNKNLKSGDLAKVYLYDADIEFTDYYWTEVDYHRLLKQAGFKIVKVHYPMGKEIEPYPWKDEKTSSPFLIFVAN